MKLIGRATLLLVVWLIRHKNMYRYWKENMVEIFIEGYAILASLNYLLKMLHTKVYILILPPHVITHRDMLLIYSCFKNITILQ